MRIPRGQLLERDVREARGAGRAAWVRISALELRHPPRSGHRVDIPGHRQVIPEDDGMASLLCSPSSDQ